MYALVTGATSGIGLEVAKILAYKGYNLILVGRRVERLEFTKKELENTCGIKVVPYSCDLSVIEEVLELLEFTNEYKDITVVVNSAGFGKMGYIYENSNENDIELINTNITSLHLITKHFATVMEKGHILNVASIAGTIPSPFLSQYGATKAYVYSLSMAVGYELKKLKKDVHITVACPGPVDTEFQKRANASFKLKSLSPQVCARRMVKAMFKKKKKTMISFSVFVACTLMKIVPQCVAIPIVYKMQRKKVLDK